MFKIDYDQLSVPSENQPWTGLIKKNKRTLSSNDLINFFPDYSIKILDIGCGNSKFVSRDIDTVIGLDHVVFGDVDKVLDITKGLPFDDNSIDFIYASHFIEHLDYKERDEIFIEIKRVLKPKGLFFFKVPHYSHFFIAAYDHKIWNYGVSIAYTLANGSWYSHVPFFQPIYIGLNYRIGKKGLFYKFINKILNYSFRLTEGYLANYVGGIEEVQYLLVKPISDN